MILIFVGLFFMLYAPVNNFSVMLGRFPTGLNQYKAAHKVSCSRTKHNDTGESLTSNPSIPVSNALPTEPKHSASQEHSDLELFLFLHVPPTPQPTQMHWVMLFKVLSVQTIPTFTMRHDPYIIIEARHEISNNVAF